MKKILAAFATSLSLLCSATVGATPFKLDFTATDFTSSSLNQIAPEKTVMGTIWYTAPSRNAEATSIDAINLLIAGHAYTTADVASTNNGYSFGAAPCSFLCVTSGANDFLIDTRPGSTAFLYALSSQSTIWITRNVTYSVTDLSLPVSEIPEPNIFAIIGLGFAGIMISRRRRNSPA